MFAEKKIKVEFLFFSEKMLTHFTILCRLYHNFKDHNQYKSREKGVITFFRHVLINLYKNQEKNSTFNNFKNFWNFQMRFTRNKASVG